MVALGLHSTFRERGAVYVEFLLAFIPVFILFLGTVQLALVRAAQLVVREAAARACRSAIVMLDDDPSRHNSARGTLPGADGSRFAAIRSAAYVPLATLSPPVAWLTGTLPAAALDLEESVTSNAARFALGYSTYNRAGAIITLRSAPGSAELASEPIAPDATVTVHVTYLYNCSIPLVSGLVCHSLSHLLGGDMTASAWEQLRSDPLSVTRVLRESQAQSGRAQRLAHELARAETPALLAPVLLSSGRFAVLEAEMTLPNQGARYHGGYR